MIKRGWRDSAVNRLAQRIKESGFESKTILCMFDYIEYDEGRDPIATRPWDTV
jgi:gluconokinase